MQFEENGFYRKSEILTMYGMKDDHWISFSLFDFKSQNTHCFVVNESQNVLLFKESQFHFICIGDKGFDQINTVEKSIGRSVPLLVKTNSDDEYFFWGNKKIYNICKESKTLMLFQFLQKKMAKSKNADQNLRAVVTLTRPEFHLDPLKTYELSLGLKLDFDNPEFKITPSSMNVISKQKFT